MTKHHKTTRAREGDSETSAPKSEGQRLLRLAAVRLVDVAEELHVGLSTVSGWRNGVNKPGGKLRRRLLDTYGIPTESWDQRPEGDESEPYDFESDELMFALDADAPPLESTLRMLDQQLARLAMGGSDEDFKQAEGIRKLLATRFTAEKDKRVIDAYIERSLVNPERQPFYQRAVNAVVDALKPHPEALADVLAALDAAS